MRERFRLKETSAWITADEWKYIEIAKEELTKRRTELERFVRCHPFFLVTLEPYLPKLYPTAYQTEEPETVRRMLESAGKFGVGPMSAVAGTLAELAVEAMRDAGARHAIVDNGGDVALLSDREVLVGIYAGSESPFSNRIALKIRPSSPSSSRPSLVGVCTSSGTVGHSISFGNADAATVVSGSASLSDAAATTLCNSVTDASSAPQAFRTVSQVAGVKGAVVICKDTLASWGEVELVRLKALNALNAPQNCQHE